MRIGHGFDAHGLAAGRDLILGGVKIPHEKGLLGHSDADVLLHAIIDAMLGAAALGDIGTHFPPEDEAYGGISSMLLLEKTKDIIKENGYTVVNIDSTVIAQRPKLKDFIMLMRKNIAECLDIEIDRVCVKATTTEHMGYEGREEGLSAHAVCILEKNKRG